MSKEVLPHADAAPTRRPDRARSSRSSRAVLVCVVGVCLVSFGAVYLATSRFGIGMISDSVTYLTSAHNLASGQGYTSAGQPVIVFAPGYSTVLSVGENFGLDVDQGARLLSAAAFAATVVLGCVLLGRHVRSRKVLVAGTIAIGCSAVLLEIFQQAISEHLFLIVVLLFILVAESLFRSPRAWFPVNALIVLAWCAFYLRYAGIVFVGIAGLLVLVACWRTGLRSTLVRAAIVGVAGFAVPALWMRRNVDLGTGPLGSASRGLGIVADEHAADGRGAQPLAGDEQDAVVDSPGAPLLRVVPRARRHRVDGPRSH